MSGNSPSRSSTFVRSWGIWPAILLLLLVLVIPTTRLLGSSFVDSSGAFSWEHYTRLFSTTLYLNVLANTFTISFWTTLVCLLAGYPVAYHLATTNAGLRQILIIGVLVPFWTSVLIRSFAWIIILGRRGVLNQTLEALGLNGVDMIYGFWSVLIGLTQAMLPMAILTMLAVMQQIDRNFQNAAATLGARGAHVFWRIYFPLSLPGVSAAGLLVFVSSLGFFVTPVLLGSPRETMIAQLIVVQIDEMLNWGFAGAIAVLLLVASLIVFYLFDLVVGIGSLAGERRERPAREGRFWSSIGNAGGRVLAVVSWGCAYVGELFERGGLVRANQSPTATSFGTRFTALAVIFLIAAPTFVLVPISFSGDASFDWPPKGFSFQWYEALFESPLWKEAILRSVWVGLWTALLATLIGTPAAFALSRQQIPGKKIVLAGLLIPMVMPHIIVALALFYVFSQIGLVGTSLGLVLGHSIFALPYAVVTMMAVLRNYDQRLDHAAWTLGASPLRTFFRITLPIVKAGVITAFLFSFVKSFDELTVALFISGGITTTLPKQMWSESLLNISPVLAAASSLVLAVVSVLILGAAFFSGRRSATN